MSLESLKTVNITGCGDKSKCGCFKCDTCIKCAKCVKCDSCIKEMNIRIKEKDEEGKKHAELIMSTETIKEKISFTIFTGKEKDNFVECILTESGKVFMRYVINVEQKTYPMSTWNFITINTWWTQHKWWTHIIDYTSTIWSENNKIIAVLNDEREYIITSDQNDVFGYTEYLWKKGSSGVYARTFNTGYEKDKCIIS